MSQTRGDAAHEHAGLHGASVRPAARASVHHVDSQALLLGGRAPYYCPPASSHAYRRSRAPRGPLPLAASSGRPGRAAAPLGGAVMAAVTARPTALATISRTTASHCRCWSAAADARSIRCTICSKEPVCSRRRWCSDGAASSSSTPSGEAASIGASREAAVSRGGRGRQPQSRRARARPGAVAPSAARLGSRRIGMEKAPGIFRIQAAPRRMWTVLSDDEHAKRQLKTCHGCTNMTTCNMYM